MAQPGREEFDGPPALDFAGPSESQSHLEHRDALEATVFRRRGGSPQQAELTFELDSGRLRIRSVD